MRLAEVSQLPVLEGRLLVGVIDESDLLLKVHAHAARFRDPVAGAMSEAPQTLAPQAALKELEAVLGRGLVAIIADAGGFHGLITRFDLLNHLRRTLT
jgi:cystathionine beta-synthase